VKLIDAATALATFGALLLTHALTDSRQVQQTSERDLSELDDLLYLSEEGTAEEAA